MIEQSKNNILYLAAGQTIIIKDHLGVELGRVTNNASFEE